MSIENNPNTILNNKKAWLFRQHNRDKYKYILRKNVLRLKIIYDNLNIIKGEMTLALKKGFIRNTAVMLVAMMIVKLLGAVLKIPLGNILGGEGMGYFTTAFSLFSPVLAFTCSGVPAIITRVTAGRLSKGNFQDIIRYRCSGIFLGIFGGIIGTAIIFIAAVPFTVHIANSPESLMSVMLIAPSVLFCSVTAVYRGYYEGLSDMLPTAVSQVIEAVVKAGVGVGLSYFVYAECVHKFGNEEQALPYAAAAAIFGVTTSEFCGMVYMLIQRRKPDLPLEKSMKKADFSIIIGTSGEILREAMPLALGAVISNLISFTDLLTVSNCVNISYSLFPEQLAGGAIPMNSIKGIDDPGNFLYGSYSGMVLSVYMLTATLPMLIARCSYPKLVCTVELDKNDNMPAVMRNINLMLKATMLISAPMSLFISVLAEPVLSILYPVRLTEASLGVIPLQVLSIGGIFSAYDGAVMSVFNAYGDFKTPVRATLYSGIVKFILNIVLMLIPGVNIIGAAVATSVSNLFSMYYSMNRLKKKFGIDLSLRTTAFPQLIAASISAVAAFYAYSSFITRFSQIISVIFTCSSCGLLYFMILFISDSGELMAVIKNIRDKKCRGVL